MKKFGKYISKRILFFKRFRIGVILLSGAFKTITLDHYKYFLFCIILTVIQLFRIHLFGLIDPQIPFSTLLTEFLAGQNFFEIIINYFKGPITISKINVIINKNILFYIELLLILYINVTVAVYTKMELDKKNYKIYKIIFQSLKNWKIILFWPFLEIIILIFTALFGIVGDILQICWIFFTALSIQIIAFEKVTFINIFKKLTYLFKKTFANVLGIDLIINLILIILAGFFYFLYKTKIASIFNFLDIKPATFIYLIFIFYLISVVMITEVISFTRLYYILTSDKN